MILSRILSHDKEDRALDIKSKKKSERQSRSIAKSISWRVIGTIDTIIISWIVTGNISLGLAIGSVEVVTKMILYFFHERLWSNIKWGTKCRG